MFFIAMLRASAEPSMQAIVEPAGGMVGFAAVALGSGRSLGLNLATDAAHDVASGHQGFQGRDWQYTSQPVRFS